MLPILLKTLPFFAVIGLGYVAARTRFISTEAVAGLTRFVFYFALSAMLFGFAANLSLSAIFSTRFLLAYLTGSLVLWALAFTISRLRHARLDEAAMEAHCTVSGNTGFLGVPMLVMLMGKQAAGPVLMVLTTDMIVFSTLVTLMITAARERRMRWETLRILALGLLGNPMIVSMVLGLVWAATGRSLWPPVNDFLTLLGAAATPGALFAIGASLAGRSAERLSTAIWISAGKLVLHPALVAFSALVLYGVDRAQAGVMIAAASLPVAGNVYILAQHFGVAPQRVSTSILISTAVSILTVTAVIAWTTTH
ncbi:AEC family transporter [Tabrizicola sp. J26]|uniref:AEC family transporter n=1 Tax=Alitabrizicola rongguiensis TaxID=2909234 RepID=UPI001F1A3600|nr:AEC family transporter [Tabrizicola rongguiensis]MCF1707675.1 AEC family transporter [Tabrizicola rongguiensis]